MNVYVYFGTKPSFLLLQMSFPWTESSEYVYVLK